MQATASPRELQITAEVKPPAGGGGDYLAPPKNEIAAGQSLAIKL